MSVLSKTVDAEEFGDDDVAAELDALEPSDAVRAAFDPRRPGKEGRPAA